MPLTAPGPANGVTHDVAAVYSARSYVTPAVICASVKLRELPAANVTVAGAVSERYAIGVGVTAAAPRSDALLARDSASAGIPDGGEAASDSLTEVATLAVPSVPLAVIPPAAIVCSVVLPVVELVTVADDGVDVGVATGVVLTVPPPQPARTAATAAMAPNRDHGEPLSTCKLVSCVRRMDDCLTEM